MHKNAGLTLIEILIVMGIFVVLMSATFLLANPAGMFAGARNTQRASHMSAIVNAIRQNVADNRGGSFLCANGDIPTTTAKRMAIGSGNYDIAPCVVPIYIQNLPFDPATSSAHYVSVTDYDTGYYVMKNATTGEITVSAPAAELGKTISVTR